MYGPSLGVENFLGGEGIVAATPSSSLIHAPPAAAADLAPFLLETSSNSLDVDNFFNDLDSFQSNPYGKGD